MTWRPSQWLHPITRRRLRNFRSLRRAWWSFWILVAAYVLSLGAELFCNQNPLYLRLEGRAFYPAFRYYSERDVLGEGHLTRADFKAIVRSARFRREAGDRVVWPLIPYGPLEIIKPDSIALPDDVVVQLAAEPRVGSINVTPEGRVTRAVAAGYFFGTPDGGEEGRLLAGDWTLPAALQAGVAARFRNEASPAVAARVRRGGIEAEISLLPYAPREVAPRTVRMTLRDVAATSSAPVRVVFGRDLSPRGDEPALWRELPADTRDRLRDAARRRFDAMVEPLGFALEGRLYRASFVREDVRFPFRPVKGHPLGIDGAGRDVLARLLYGLRTSMTFGMILVAASMLAGTLFGAMQGYHGGRVDLLGQRLLEIWDSLPFLYILILVGSIYGRSFLLLLACYAAFNWIGISYYMRAEFLRLRHQTFVEAARSLGLPASAIMFRHILPNALVPLVTFFPFSLVSAIGTLAALDYLGFGLPPPTPSWGEMLAQAQEYRWAWWLTLYPSLALFVVMLLGVFVGEGVRQAFDPRKFSRME